MIHDDINVVALAGGVGGAKLVFGLAKCLAHTDLTIIVNTGDDFKHFGLHISPDVDTVCYTLAGLANPDTGWGLANETWQVLSALEKLAAPTWFQLGDKDLATHLERTRRLQQGDSLSEITQDFCKKWGVQCKVLPMSNDPVQTLVHTEDNEIISFQEYFVHRKFKPKVMGFEFAGIDHARPSPGLIEAIEKADLIIISPSNPFVSIDPILGVRGVRNALENKVVIAVSPIVGGKALKGPAAKMFLELGINPSVTSVAHHYKQILVGLVIDTKDTEEVKISVPSRIIYFETNTIMKNENDRIRLAREVIEFGKSILTGEVS